MGVTVESVCDALERQQLMPSDEVSAVRQRWFRPTREGVADVERFRKWLVSNHFVTEFQAGLLVRGQADNLHLGQYRLIERVAKGRLTGQYKAVDPDGQLVAVKLLPPSKAANPDVVTRFQREAKQALKLNHPNVLRTLDTGTTNGQCYAVTEYLEGDTLDDVVQRRGKLPPLQAARVLAHALLGLQHVHEQGLTHGDIKPATIMLANPAPSGRRESGPKTVKLLDVGLGSALFEEDTSSGPGAGYELLPVTGELQLNDKDAEFSAPEKIRDPRSADIRADVYSLGCVMYFLLTGEKPFRSTNVLQRLAESPRPFAETNPDVPEMLQQIVDQMMANDPAERYQTPARAAKALRVFLASEEEAQARPEDEAPEPVFRAPRAERAERAEPAPRAERAEHSAQAEAVAAKPTVEALWDEVKPTDRDFVYMGIGMGILLVFGSVLALLIGHTLFYFLFFCMGAIAGPVTERLITWFRRRQGRSVVEEEHITEM